MSDDIQFVGGDEDSDAKECPAVWRVPGGVHIRGKTITDPAVTERHNLDVGKGDDETDVWLGEDMFPVLRDALDDTFERGMRGEGPHEFERLAAAARQSVIRFECRDAYDVLLASTFEEWRATGSVADHQLGEFADTVAEAIARGVRWRRVRVISRPMSDYMRWEHAVTDSNIAAGEDIRWLWRDQAADLLVPAADCWVFDLRVVRFNFQRGDDSNPHLYSFTSDPRIARDLAGAFEMAWARATPHADFEPE